MFLGFPQTLSVKSNVILYLNIVQLSWVQFTVISWYNVLKILTVPLLNEFPVKTFFCFWMHTKYLCIFKGKEAKFKYWKNVHFCIFRRDPKYSQNQLINGWKQFISHSDPFRALSFKKHSRATGDILARFLWNPEFILTDIAISPAYRGHDVHRFYNF